MLELFLIGLFCFFYILGGQTRGSWRDVPCPLILGGYVGFKIGLLAGILTWAGANVIRLGYGNYSPHDDPKPSWLGSLTHDTGGWWIRAIWGGLVAAGAGGALAYYTGSYGYYILYIIFNSSIGFVVSKGRFNVFFTDLLVSLGLCLVVAWVKNIGG